MPKAVIWYGVYCHAVALFNLVLTAVCAVFVLRHEALANEFLPAGVVLWTGVVLGPVAFALAVANLWLPRAERLKRPWAVHMSNIVAGIGTCVLIPLALPLLVAWFHPDVRQWYERGAGPTGEGS